MICCNNPNHFMSRLFEKYFHVLPMVILSLSIVSISECNNIGQQVPQSWYVFGISLFLFVVFLLHLLSILLVILKYCHTFALE